jgi:hypothetical protein
MKHLKQLLAVILLVLTLGIPAYAGDMEMPGFTAPPPPRPSASVLASGGMETGANDATSENIDTPGFTEIALNLIIGAISIF